MADLDDVGVLKRQPINRNFLSQLNYKFILHRAPNVTFFLQRVNLPGFNIPPVRVGNPFVNIPHSGDHITFQPLAIEYKVDEDFANYFEIQRWMYGLGFPENYGQYHDLKKNPPFVGEGLASDISVMILNSVRKPNIEIIFHDCFPTSISDLVFSTTPPDVDYLEATATFAYTFYEVQEV